MVVGKGGGVEEKERVVKTGGANRKTERWRNRKTKYTS